MKKNILHSLVLLICLDLTLNADNLYLKLADANKSVLQKLSKQIEMKKQASGDTALQRILLKKLESFNVSYKNDINLPKALTQQKEYEELFKNYIADLEDIFTTQKVLENMQNALRLLENNINSSNVNENTTLTLQLQYAYHQKQIKFYKNKIETLQKIIDRQKDLISNNLSSVRFDNQSIKNKLTTLTQVEQKIRNLMTKLKLETEKYQLLEDINHVNKIQSMITLEEEQLQVTLKRKLVQQFLDFSAILQNKDKKVFEVQEAIKSTVNEMSLTDEFKENFLSFINAIVTEHMGMLTTITASTSQSISASLTNLFNMLNEPLFTINEVQISSLKMIIALIIFLFGFFLGGLYKRYISILSAKRTSISASTRTLLSNLGYYFIIVISFFISLKMLGINLSSLTLVAGALSVGIGFGLQNIVSNFVSGMILMFEKSVKVDDYVELSDSLRGKIVDIRMRSTVINTNANIDVIVPNQNFIQNNVINWTMNDNIRRFDIPFGVAYGTHANKVLEVVKNAVDNSGFSDIYISKEKFTRVLMSGMGDSSVNFELLVWIKGVETLYPKRTTSRFLILIYNALYENDITIPFPQLDLHIKKD